MPDAAGEAATEIRALVTEASARLRAAGADSPRLDAELLLGHVLARSRAELVLDAATDVPPRAAAAFDALVSRRCQGEPVAYLVGTRDFRRITLAVDPRVLIPRPETELLVEVALALPQGARVLDVGTGSGAVALALADERPDLEVWGSDVSADALAVAAGNAQRLGLPVQFVRSNLLAEVPGRFDAVVANLPYVESGYPLPRDVAAYEPAGALFGGPDGLDVVRALVEELGSVAWVALEIGAGQADAVAELLRAAGYGSVARHRDLAGIERVVAAWR